MKFGAWILGGFLLLLAAAGCDTVLRAREAQATFASPDEMGAPASLEDDIGATEDGEEADVPETEDVADTDEAETNAVERLVLAGYRLPEFVAFAYTNRPDMLSAFLAVSNAALAVRAVQAEGPFVPQVSASGGYNRSTQNRGTHFSDHMDGDPWGSLDVNILVCDFGRNAALERAARENLLAVGETYRATRLNAFHEVATAYFTLLCKDALLEAAYTNETQYAQHLAQAEELLRNQEAKKLDVLRARLDLSEARQKTILASNELVTAELDFFLALGLSPECVTRADVLPPASNRLASVRQELDVEPLDLAEGLARAREGAPSLAAARARVRGASAEVDYRIAELLPEISLNAGVSFAEKVWNWSWGSALLQSVFTGYRKTTAVDAAVVAMAEQRTAYEQAELQTARDLGAALSVRDTAREELAAARVSVVQARENLDTAAGQLLVGDISRIDFSDAVSSYTAALSARVKAFYAGQIAEAALLRLTGNAPLYVDRMVNE